LHLARRHYENFTVASWLAPRRLRPHLAAVYAFCRWADDLADETSDPAHSLRLLGWWEEELRRCYAGEARHPVFVALAETIRARTIPAEPFADLLSAFRQDQRQSRYETAADVLDYCRRSANPVGRIVLFLGQCHDERTGALSDRICTGLQLVNFCQDVAQDFQRQRVYLPAETLARHGVPPSDLGREATSAALKRAVREEVDRAESYLLGGMPLVGIVPAGLRAAVELFVGGGLAIVAAIRRIEYDVCRVRPTVSRWAKARLAAAAWFRSLWP
jgi:squalene synthase HpnC